MVLVGFAPGPQRGPNLVLHAATLISGLLARIGSPLLRLLRRLEWPECAAFSSEHAEPIVVTLYFPVLRDDVGNLPGLAKFKAP